MLQPFEDFERLGVVSRNLTSQKSYRHNGDNPHRHIFIDKGASVLAVAHLDSVKDPGHFWINDHYVACPTIDNRLGAWLILEYLPSVGIVTDVLLTEGEESGRTTARDFVAPEGKKYNWMFSFDRMGTDVACYQYNGKELKDVLKPYGLEAVHGSFSDIAALERLGCRGMNFGCAMYSYHSDTAYANLHELRTMVASFLCFYEDHKEVHFPYTPTPAREWNTYGRNYNKDYDELDWGEFYASRRQTSTKQWDEKRDKERAQKAYKELKEKGSENEFFEKCGPMTWWSLNALSKSTTFGKDWTNQCKRCGFHFHNSNTMFCNTTAKSYCKYCFMEVMELLEFVQPDWYRLGLLFEHELKEGYECDYPTIANRANADFRFAFGNDSY